MDFQSFDDRRAGKDSSLERVVVVHGQVGVVAEVDVSEVAQALNILAEGQEDSSGEIDCPDFNVDFSRSGTQRREKSRECIIALGAQVGFGPVGAVKGVLDVEEEGGERTRCYPGVRECCC